MPTAKCSDNVFIELFTSLGPKKTGEKLGITKRDVLARRARLEVKMHSPIKSPASLYHPTTSRCEIERHPERKLVEINNGIVLIGSDSHYWPGEVSAAHRAFCYFAKELQPKIIIKNGDELDGATISRHQPIGWENRPSLKAELETVKERHAEIMDACKNAQKIWPLGNHDGRFETRLAAVAPEYGKIHGVHLKDHFPEWEPCWSVWVNDVVVKHRYKGGVHATHNNTKDSGRSMITGHLHSLKVTPWTDYNGTRFGVDCGTMADPFGPQFRDYMEDNPRNWRSGFAIITFHKGKMLWPEVVHVINEDDGLVEFRGKVYKV